MTSRVRAPSANYCRRASLAFLISSQSLSAPSARQRTVPSEYATQRMMIRSSKGLLLPSCGAALMTLVGGVADV